MVTFLEWCFDSIWSDASDSIIFIKEFMLLCSSDYLVRLCTVVHQDRDANVECIVGKYIKDLE